MDDLQKIEHTLKKLLK